MIVRNNEGVAEDLPGLGIDSFKKARIVDTYRGLVRARSIQSAANQYSAANARRRHLSHS